MVVSWHRAIGPNCWGRQWELGLGTSAPHPNWNGRGGRSCGMQLHGLEFGQPTGVKWHSSSCIPLFAGLKKFTHHLPYTWESSTGSCDWLSRACNKGNWVLLTYEIWAAAHMKAFHSSSSFKNEVTHTRSHSWVVEGLVLDFRNSNFNS